MIWCPLDQGLAVVEWPLLIFIAIVATVALYGLAIAISFVCGLFCDPNKQPPSDPASGWD